MTPALHARRDASWFTLFASATALLWLPAPPADACAAEVHSYGYVVSPAADATGLPTNTKLLIEMPFADPRDPSATYTFGMEGADDPMPLEVEAPMIDPGPLEPETTYRLEVFNDGGDLIGDPVVFTTGVDTDEEGPRDAPQATVEMRYNDNYACAEYEVPPTVTISIEVQRSNDPDIVGFFVDEALVLNTEPRIIALDEVVSNSEPITYTVAAVDRAGNIGPSVDVVADVSAFIASRGGCACQAPPTGSFPRGLALLLAAGLLIRGRTDRGRTGREPRQRS
jgi:MYXO-CTERM domain-containing protein